MEITQDDFDRWKQDPVTIEIFRDVLQERKNTIAHMLADGGALIQTEREVMVGRYKEIDDLMQIQFKDIRKREE
jgi:hypothetical protein